jgi:hypothetical protein
VPYAAAYEVQLATNSAFTVGAQLSAHTSSPYSFASPLSEGKYYWRVRGINSNDQAGAWSAIGSFTVDLSAPAFPVITKPLPSAEARGAPVFAWNAVSGATRYQIQIDESGGNFDVPAYDSGLITRTNLTAAFSSPGSWKWRLRAQDAAGNFSSWTAERDITIIEPFTLAPVLNSPAAGAKTNDNTPVFTWSAVPLGTVYQIQIDNQSNFASPERDFTAGAGVLSYAPALLPDGTYYWRVRAYNGNTPPEAGAWSPGRVLVIGNFP